MGMILGQTDFEELIVVKNEFAGDSEDFLEDAIGSERCQGRMGQDSGAEHTEEIVSQVIQQDQHLLSMPTPLAAMGEEESLLIIANVNFGCPAQIIEMADFWCGSLQVGNNEERMLELVVAHIQPAQCQGPRRDTEVQLLNGDSHPTASWLDLLPVLDLLAPGTSSTVRIVLGT